LSFITLLLIAVGLSIDCFAVAISSGIALKCFRIRYALRVGLFFGGFQALMPVIGWFAGLSFKQYIENYDHWVAFAMLAAIGGKMIYEATLLEEAEKSCDPRNLLLVFGLAIATSIDALAVGISFSVLGISILTPVLIIGLVSFIAAYSGMYIGDKFGDIFGNKVEIFGGIILILIGLKILIEHLFF
jgi:putative Mn2+ efflux pump MntP